MLQEHESEGLYYVLLCQPHHLISTTMLGLGSRHSQVEFGFSIFPKNNSILALIYNYQQIQVGSLDGPNVKIDVTLLSRLCNGGLQTPVLLYVSAVPLSQRWAVLLQPLPPSLPPSFLLRLSPCLSGRKLSDLAQSKAEAERGSMAALILKRKCINS